MKKFNFNSFMLGAFIGGIIGILIHAYITGTLFVH